MKNSQGVLGELLVSDSDRQSGGIQLSEVQCPMRRCQIKVQFESGAKKKFLTALFQPTTSLSDYQSVPWSHSFQNIYNTYMCKIYLTLEK